MAEASEYVRGPHDERTVPNIHIYPGIGVSEVQRTWKWTGIAGVQLETIA